MSKINVNELAEPILEQSNKDLVERFDVILNECDNDYNKYIAQTINEVIYANNTFTIKLIQEVIDKLND